MSDIWIFIIALVVWFFLQTWLLPKLGSPPEHLDRSAGRQTRQTVRRRNQEILDHMVELSGYDIITLLVF
jgi:uncharacterized protein HemY